MTPSQGAFTRSSRLELTAHDHTQAIRLLMENPKSVGRALESLKRGLDPEAIAEAAFNAVPDVPDEFREKLRAAGEASRALRAAASKVTVKDRALATKLMAEVRAQETASDKLELLKRLRAEGRFDKQPNLAVGVDVAVDILADGLSTIYLPGFPFYTVLARGTVTPRQATKDTKESAPSQVATSDANGAIEGALAGVAGGLILGGLHPPAAVAGVVGGVVGGGLAWGIVQSAGSVADLIGDWWNKKQPRS